MSNSGYNIFIPKILGTCKVNVHCLTRGLDFEKNRIQYLAYYLFSVIMYSNKTKDFEKNREQLWDLNNQDVVAREIKKPVLHR